MNQLKINFLNWRPDVDEYQNDGLTVADNVYHDVGGYKQVLVPTTTSFATVSAGYGVGVVDVIWRQAGAEMGLGAISGVPTRYNKVFAELTYNTALSGAYLAVDGPDNLGLGSVAATLVRAGGTTASVAQGTAFLEGVQTCELNDFLFTTCHAEAEEASGTACSANVTAYMTITSATLGPPFYGNSSVTEVTPNGISCGTVNQFVVIADDDNQWDVRWCAIGDPTDWPTPGTADARAKQAGSQTLPNKFGRVTGIAGGDFYGYVFQERAITKMTYVGGDVVFNFDTFHEGEGCFAPNRYVSVDDAVFFESEHGYRMLVNDTVTPIGLGRVDETYPPSA